MQKPEFLPERQGESERNLLPALECAPGGAGPYFALYEALLTGEGISQSTLVHED